MLIHIDDIHPDNRLTALGWQPIWQGQHEPMRVVAVNRKSYVLWGASGQRSGVLSGRLHRLIRQASEQLPTTGDWVDFTNQEEGQLGQIRGLLPRINSLTRKSGNKLQPLCANVNIALVAVPLHSRLNLSMLERYIALATQPQIKPVVLLTWSDKRKRLLPLIRTVRRIAPNASVYAIDARSRKAAESLIYSEQVKGQTLVVLGASGVGKSTLVNSLLKDGTQATGNLRSKDYQGQHVTSSRMLLLSSQMAIIDTPGLRQLSPQINRAELVKLFPDVLNLANQCRFRDCQHQNEPDCAIQAALKKGSLVGRRWKSLKKILETH